jgi:hypothetical protein
MTPLMNPSPHFALAANRINPDEIVRCHSHLYVDNEGFTRWQGETSGLPVLDLLIEAPSLVAQKRARLKFSRDSRHP